MTVPRLETGKVNIIDEVLNFIWTLRYTLTAQKIYNSLKAFRCKLLRGDN